MEAEILHMIDNLDEMMMMTGAPWLGWRRRNDQSYFYMDNRSFYKPNLEQEKRKMSIIFEIMFVFDRVCYNEK